MECNPEVNIVEGLMVQHRCLLILATYLITCACVCRARVVYCVVTDPVLSQRHDKIGMMTARHRVGPCRYHDGGGKWGNFTVTRGRPRWISQGHVS